MNKSSLAKAVHEEADSRARGANHLRQQRMGHFGDLWFVNAFFAKLGELQEHAGKAFFTGVKELIGKGLLVAGISGKKKSYKHFRKPALRFQQRNHGALLNANHRAL